MLILMRSSLSYQHLRPRAACALLLGLGAIVGACGSDDSAQGSAGREIEPLPDADSAAELMDGGAVLVVANSAGTISTNGDQRILLALLGDGPGDYLGSADAPATFEFMSEDGGTVIETAGEWLSTTGVDLGLYVSTVTFDSDGVWQVKVKETNGPSSSFNVSTESAVPDLGDPAPLTETPISSDGRSLSDISTDPSPDPKFYELSVADAVRSGKPSVIVFSTPAFCQTAICGPTIEIVKAVAAKHSGAQYVHVEPYDILKAKAGQLIPVDAMSDWNLQTEPWVFVVGSDGRVAASFEGVVGEAELSDALERVS